MASSNQNKPLTPAQIKNIRERLTCTNRKLTGMERSLKNMKGQHQLVLKELELSTRVQREEAEAEGGVISRIMEYIIDIKDIIEIMKITFQEVYNNENKMAEKICQFEEAFMKNNERIIGTVERYRILSQLGELDSKILSLKFNGIHIDSSIAREVLKLRGMILTENEIHVQELQEKALKLFRQFAENIENAIDSVSYKGETRKILESMREVCWM